MKSSSTSTIGLVDARTAGVSGDKFLGAFIDLGASEATLRKVAKVVENSLPGTRKVTVEVNSVERGEVQARLVKVAAEEVSKRKAEIFRKSVEDCSEKLRLSKWGKAFARSTVDTLLKAESRVHGHSLAQLELHELGSADTLVDILGVAYLAEELGLTHVEWWSTSIGVGIGTTHFSGRDYPNPPPAVAEILRAHRFPILGGQVAQELTTPTGAAIAVNLARKASDNYPAIRPERIGYGAGAKELKEVANVLRMTVGEREEGSHSHDEMVVLETNLDDVTGEVVGHALERLMAAGARDVTVSPVYMKKNRPGHVVSVIADSSSAERLARVMMEETGTLGVREIPVRRHITLRAQERRVVEIKGKPYPVRVKTALDKKGRVVREKVEYEDRNRLSKETGLGIRAVDELVRRGSQKGRN